MPLVHTNLDDKVKTTGRTTGHTATSRLGTSVCCYNPSSLGGSAHFLWATRKLDTPCSVEQIPSAFLGTAVHLFGTIRCPGISGASTPIASGMAESPCCLHPDRLQCSFTLMGERADYSCRLGSSCLQGGPEPHSDCYHEDMFLLLGPNCPPARGPFSSQAALASQHGWKHAGPPCCCTTGEVQ